MVLVMRWVVSLSWAREVAGPPTMTRLPFGVHLAAESQTLAWRGALLSASLQGVVLPRLRLNVG